VLYDPKFYRCEAILINGPWSAPSNISRGLGKTSATTQSPGVWDVSARSTSSQFSTDSPDSLLSVRHQKGTECSVDYQSEASI
jgi:hypothetical protein